MARKKNSLACPSCQTKLLDGCERCTGIIITCPHCGASVLADIDENGRMRLSVEPQATDGRTTQMKAVASN